MSSNCHIYWSVYTVSFFQIDIIVVNRFCTEAPCSRTYFLRSTIAQQRTDRQRRVQAGRAARVAAQRRRHRAARVVIQLLATFVLLLLLSAIAVLIALDRAYSGRIISNVAIQVPLSLTRTSCRTCRPPVALWSFPEGSNNVSV